MRHFMAYLSLVLLSALFVGLVFINNQLLDAYRIDLTENKVYSLSAGSEAVIKDIKEPINLYYFFSDDASKGMTGLRNYANRVQSLLEEFASRSNGKIRLQQIDPEPFSESEDRADAFGLTGASVGAAGENLYFGLAGTNRVDDQFTIEFFDPQKEQFLEYDISKLIFQLSNPKPIRLALVTDLPVDGGQNPMTGQYSQPMVFYDQLTQLMDVTVVRPDGETLPDDTDVLMLAHAKSLSEPLRYAIDQFAMNKGRILAFVDPHYESDPVSMMGAMGANASDMSLLSSWGINIVPDKVVLDPGLALEVRSPQGGIVKHPGILGLTATELDRKDVITANLESVNGASFGIVALANNSDLTLEPLATTSPQGLLIDAQTYAETQDPAVLQRKMGSAGNTMTLAARISGFAKSAFDEASAEGAANWVGATDSLNLIVVADADLLNDHYWVQQSGFFGQTMYTPFANNGDLITNSAENLGGSSALISIRSRGTFSRPFARVQTLESQAQSKFREHEQRLQAQLEETERQLAALQSEQGTGGALAINADQQAAIDKYVEKRISIRRELREVQYQLERDIDALGNGLKLLNIAVAPLVLIFVLYLLTRLLRRRAGKSYREVSS